jgi:type I restriction enzyme, S subunit
MSELPKGWGSASVKDLAGTAGIFVDGDWVESKDQDPNGDIRLLQLADIGDGVFLDKSDRWINADAFTRLRCTELATGDVLIARMPDPLGRACLMPPLEQRCVTVVDVAALRVDPQVADNRWVMHTVNAPQLRAEISAQASGTTRKRISRGNLGGLQIPLPPEAEQKRIADKLDTVLTRLDAVNTRLARVAPLLKRFRQSVLAAATSGRLTEDWRTGRAESDFREAVDELMQVMGVKKAQGTLKPTAIRPAPYLYEVKSLSSLGQVSGGLTKNAARNVMPLRRPYLRVANVYANELRLSDVSEIGLTAAELQKTRLLLGDLLLVEGNGSLDQIGRVAMWDGSIEDCSHQNHLIRWRAGDQVISKFVLYYLLSPLGRAQIEEVAKSTSGLHTLSVSKVAALSLKVPDLQEQTEIVRRIETLFAFADRLEARLQTAQTATERLTPSLLAKAFCGELVPQDPNDEPASELLKRLAEQGPTSKTTRQVRKVKSK